VINAIVSVFYFPSTSPVKAFSMLRLDVKLGKIWSFSPLIFVKGHFQETGIATLSIRLKPRHVEKILSMLVDRHRRKWVDRKEETCAI